MFAPRILVALIGVATLVAADRLEPRSSPPPSAATTPPDRVGFPSDYATFEVIRRTNVPNKQQTATVYANKAAAVVKDLSQLPYPAGAVIVFEWRKTEQDAAGAPVMEADGLWRRADLVQIDVMRHEPGYGAIYGEKRTGEWEFASYAPDGSPLKLGAETQACAKCHNNAAARDFVFRGRFPAIEKK